MLLLSGRLAAADQHVRDSTGKPIQGAVVTIEGAADGVKTDAQGAFKLACQPGQSIVVIAGVSLAASLVPAVAAARVEPRAALEE